MTATPPHTPIHLAPHRLSTAWQSADRVIDGFIRVLPDLAIAAIVFVLCGGADFQMGF